MQMQRDARIDTSQGRRETDLSFSARSEGDSRIYTFPLSSEEPYRRWGMDEVLVHEPDAVDLSFLNSGNAPVLHQHNRSEQIGVIERAWLGDDRRIYVDIRFSRRALGREVQDDVDDGIVTNVSVGYDIMEVQYTDREDGSAPDEYRVTKWKPVEASMVSIPADPTVGVGRSDNQMEGMMPPENTTTVTATLPPVAATAQRDPAPAATPAPAPAATPAPAPAPVDTAQRDAEIAGQIEEIAALAASHNRSDLANEFIGEALRAGRVPSLALFRGTLRGELPDDAPLVNNDIGLTQTETRNFSIVNLARTLMDNAPAGVREAAAFEIEACEAAARAYEGQTQGIRLPMELMNNWTDFEVDGQRAPLATTTTPNVQNVEHLATRFIDNLRNASSILRAGVTTLPGLSGNVEIPGGDQNAVMGWLAAEDDDAPETNPTFRNVMLEIKDLAGFTDLTRRMLMQSTIAIEQYVRSQLLVAMALGIDTGGLQGSGAAGVPRGLRNTTGIGAVGFATAGAPTRDEIIDLRTDVASNNAMIGQMTYLGNSLMAGQLMKTRTDPGSGNFLLNDGGTQLISGRFIESNQVADGDLFYGNFSDMLMGMWGGLDLDRDVAAKFLSGGLRLRAIQSVDFAVQRVGSFALGQ